MRETIPGIYVPGLGDDKKRGEDKLGLLWSAWHGIDLEYHPVHWKEGQHFQPKLTKLLEHIDRLYRAHGRVALIGSSAGASAVLNAYAHESHKVSAVVSLCGKILNPQTISHTYQQENPAFMESLAVLPDNLSMLDPDELQRVLSVIPRSDGTVPLADMVIDGAQEHHQFTFGHAPSIALGMTLASRPAAQFIRQQAG